MDQIVKLVQEKTGISEDQARTAVTTVIDFIKTKLPPPIASQVDGALGPPAQLAEDPVSSRECRSDGQFHRPGRRPARIGVRGPRSSTGYRSNRSARSRITPMRNFRSPSSSGSIHTSNTDSCARRP